MTDAPLQKCRDCGHTTQENTVGTPNSSCPERAAVYATHRYEVIA
jgi:predicted Zn-ribbon and HTH transcriptional regulator